MPNLQLSGHSSKSTITYDLPQGRPHQPVNTLLTYVVFLKEEADDKWRLLLAKDVTWKQRFPAALTDG